MEIINYESTETKHSPITKHFATVTTKNSLLKAQTSEQTQIWVVWPSALTGWFDREGGGSVKGEGGSKLDAHADGATTQ